MEKAPTVTYKQELSRSIGLVGSVSITLSAVTPAASLFVIVPVVLTSAGTGSITSMVLAGFIGLFMALCWAELAAMFPVSGGDYSLVWHAFKGISPFMAGVASFITFSMMLSSIAVIPATLALGTGDYLNVVCRLQPQITGAVVTAVATLIAILHVRRAALITGLFLAIEIAVLVLVTILGFAHWRRNPITSKPTMKQPPG